MVFWVENRSLDGRLYRSHVAYNVIPSSSRLVDVSNCLSSKCSSNACRWLKPSAWAAFLPAAASEKPSSGSSIPREIDDWPLRLLAKCGGGRLGNGFDAATRCLVGNCVSSIALYGLDLHGGPRFGSEGSGGYAMTYLDKPASANRR